ncbi:uncharacterized protein AKAW2_70351S [Aspergillus luchuensis]|uniref:Uncharacterized protein n=1 Tax=Aspergillus kawachii TaxID=1069201 RepID=A0A7R7WI77_ASPKA|nr:uncharacterized protein AKAW2_70351S [Aspergillus luchuensis]BCS03472.1 hypothetical protein AKAW2_70351S [Aspergillus luchuensis]
MVVGGEESSLTLWCVFDSVCTAATLHHTSETSWSCKATYSPVFAIRLCGRVKPNLGDLIPYCFGHKTFKTGLEWFSISIRVSCGFGDVADEVDVVVNMSATVADPLNVAHIYLSQKELVHAEAY